MQGDTVPVLKVKKKKKSTLYLFIWLTSYVNKEGKRKIADLTANVKDYYDTLFRVEVLYFLVKA